MRKIAVAGVSALSIAAGSVAVAAAVPTGAVLAQDTGPTTSAPPTSGPTGPTGRAAAGGPLGRVLQSLVDDGTITKDQADKIRARVADTAAQAKGGIGKGALGKGGPGARLGATLEEVATFLGTDVASLKDQLRTKSLGEIAGDKKAGLVQLLTDKANARIDGLVSSGKLTADQATKLKAEAATRIGALVDRVGGVGGVGGAGGPLGGGRRGGR